MAFDTMTQLGQMQKVPLDMTLDGLAALRQTQQADNIGLQELMRKQAYEQQMDPLRVAEQGLRNKGLILDQQKSDYELRKLGRNDKMETELWDQAKATALAKMLDQEGEANANMFGQQLYQRLQKTQPGTREYKAIVGALQTTKGWMEKQRDHQQRLGEIGESGRQQRLTNAEANAARMEMERLKVSARQAMTNAKSPKDFEQLAAQFSQSALALPPGPERDELMENARFATSMAERLRPVAPQVNPAAVGGGELLQPARPAAMPPDPKKAPISFDADKERRYQEWVKKQQGQ